MTAHQPQDPAQARASVSTADFLGVFYDLYEIRHRRVAVPLAVQRSRGGRVTGADLWAGDWPPAPIPDDPGAADADLSVVAWDPDGPMPRTEFTIGHDDLSLQGMDSLALYGDQAEPVLRGLLDGSYAIDRLEPSPDGGMVVLAAKGLPDLVAEDRGRAFDAYARALAVRMLHPSKDGPSQARPGPSGGFRLQVQPTIGGVFINDSPGAMTLERAVDGARTLASLPEAARTALDRLPVPPDGELLEAVPGRPGWDRRITAAWRLDAFWGGEWGGAGYRICAWVAMVAYARGGGPEDAPRPFTVIRRYDGVFDEPGRITRPDAQWTVDARLSRTQLRALCPLLVDGARIVACGRDGEVRP